MRYAAIILVLFAVLVSGCVQQPEDQGELTYPDSGAPATKEPIELAQRLDGGDTSAIPEMIDYLDSNEVLMTEPPGLARDFAHSVLVNYAGEDFGYDKQAWYEFFYGTRK